MKTCKKCKVQKDLSEFSPHESTKDGLVNECKKCASERVSEYYYANKQKVKDYQASYRTANKDRIAAYQREWRRANLEEVAAYQAAYRVANKARIATQQAKHHVENRERNLARSAAWAERNKDLVTSRTRAWKKANPRLVAISNKNRRDQKRGAGKYTSADIERLFELQKGGCACCKRSILRGYHIDHIIAIANGGSNWPGNLQLLCARCNLKKGVKDPMKFMQEIGYLL